MWFPKAIPIGLLFCAAISAQTEKPKIDCDKASVSPASTSLPSDVDFSLAYTADPQFAEEDIVKRKAAPKVAIYAIVPRDGCELRTIFRRCETTQRNLTEEDYSKLKESLAPLSELETTLPDASRSVTGFYSFVKHSDAGYIAILGHSENGVFRFPDGSLSTLTGMAQECAMNGKRCIFPACLLNVSPAEGFTGARADSVLSVKDVLTALGSIQGYLERDSGGLSLGELVRKPIKGHEKETEVTHQVYYLVDKSRNRAVIGAIVALGLVKTGDEATRAVRSSLDSRPVALNSPRPHYTKAARNHKVQGMVLLRALVGADGTVKQVMVIAGLPDGLNDEALKAVSQLRFKPAMKDGEPVACWQAIDIEFDLYGRFH